MEGEESQVQSDRESSSPSIDKVADGQGINLKSKIDQHGTENAARARLKSQMPKLPESASTYACQLCSYKNAKRSSVARHVRAVHSNIREHICTKCGAAFAHRYHLKSHYGAVHLKLKSNVCKVCGTAFARKSTLKSHEQSVHLKIKNHICTECGRAFTVAKLLKNHYVSVHLKLKLNACKVCSTTFATKSNLRSHEKAVHFKVKNHICTDCGLAFTWPNQLKIHYRSHLSKSRKNPLLVEAHNEVAKQPSRVIDAQMPSTESGKSECDAVDVLEDAELMTRISQMEERVTRLKGNFAFIEVAQNAIAAKLGLDLTPEIQENDMAPEIQEKADLQCPYKGTIGCTYTGTRHHHLANHIKTHLPESEKKSLACDRCERKFADDSNLRRHKKQIHDKMLKWRCDKCKPPYASSLKRDLMRHYKTRTHRWHDMMETQFGQTKSTTLQEGKRSNLALEDEKLVSQTESTAVNGENSNSEA